MQSFAHGCCYVHKCALLHTSQLLLDHAAKLVLLDRLLPWLQSKGSKVLIFSHMTRMLDILEDYMLFRRQQYCRIDGRSHVATCLSDCVIKPMMMHVCSQYCVSPLLVEHHVFLRQLNPKPL